jgi:multiple sugar transport system permease protein
MRGLRTELFRHLALLLACAFFVLPFLWIASSAFKTQIAILTGQFSFKPTLGALKEVLFSPSSDYLHDFRNSFIIASASTLAALVIATVAAHALVRLKSPVWVSVLILSWGAAFQMIPPITIADGWYTLFRIIGLNNTLTGVALAHMTLNLPIAIWLMHAFTREVPDEIVDAARMDGAGEFSILWLIVMPLVKPGLAAAAIICFIFSWNEFPVALVLTQKATATVPVGIAKYAQEAEIKYAQMAATAVLSVVPAILLLLLGQRAIVRGLTAGAIK